MLTWEGVIWVVRQQVWSLRKPTIVLLGVSTLFSVGDWGVISTFTNAGHVHNSAVL